MLRRWMGAQRAETSLGDTVPNPLRLAMADLILPRQ